MSPSAMKPPSSRKYSSADVPPVLGVARQVMDDDTEDSSDEDNHAAPAEQQSLKQRKKNRLTKVSAMYDLDGDGELDEIELAMRKYDRDGDGQLSKNEIYKIVQEQLKEKKDASQLRKVTAGLVCFVFVLALSNLGTSFASAILAKETKADSNSATMILKGTGDALGTQTSGENFDMEPLSPEENRRRRELVVKRLIDEPHGHHAHHRRMANKNKKGGSSKNTNKGGSKNKPSKQRPGEISTLFALLWEQRSVNVAASNTTILSIPREHRRLQRCIYHLRHFECRRNLLRSRR